MSLLKTKKELQAFISFKKYLNKFSAATLELCKPSWRLTSVNTWLTWTTKLLYIETDELRICLAAGLPHVKDSMNCARDKCWQYSIKPIVLTSKSFIKCWEMEQQHRQRGIRNSTWAKHIPLLLVCNRSQCNHKQNPLVTIFKKDIEMLTQWL